MSADGDTAPADILRQLQDIIRKQVPAVRRHPLPGDTPLVDGQLGFDSIGVLELLLACEVHFRIRLDSERLLDQHLTVGSLAGEIGTLRSGATHQSL